MSKLIAVEIDDSNLPAPTPESAQERRVAIFDLLEDNHFVLVARDERVPPAGPYRLALSIRERRLCFAIASEPGTALGEVHLSLGPFRQVVKDYFQICRSYAEALKTLPPGQIEAIDMARRGIHNEGARLLVERLDGKVEIDKPTSRRLFTLICVLLTGE